MGRDRAGSDRARYQEEIFTPNTRFADLAKGLKKPSFGGGMGSSLGQSVLKDKGLYPDSVVVGSYGSSTGHSTETSHVDSSGNLRIKLPAGKKIGTIEVACGDTVLDTSQPVEQQLNKDGHYGKLGWAKLHARIENEKSGEKTQDFLVNMNVPPAGVMSGGRVESNYVTKPGDEIVVESKHHRSWVMGYRVQFLEKDG